MSWASPSCGIPAATSCPVTAGRTGWVRWPSGPTRLDPAWRTIETNEFGLNEFVRWAAKADLEVMLAVNLGTRGMPEAIELLEYCQPPERHLPVRPAGEPRGQGAARDPDVVPGQRDGRPLAAGAQDGGGVRAAGRGDGPGHAPVRPRPRARRLRQFPPLDAHVRHLGGDRPRPRLRRRRLHLGARLLRDRGGRPRELPGLVAQHGELHPGRRLDRRPRRRPALARPSASTSPSTSGTSGTSRRCTSATCRRTGRWRRGSARTRTPSRTPSSSGPSW